jgi:hypothetical protein
LANFLETPKTKSRPFKNWASIKLIVWDVLPPTLDNPDATSQQDSTTITHHRKNRKNHPELSSIVDHVISHHINDPRSKHDINSDNFSLLKGVRRPDHLDAFESYNILKAKKEGKVLLNNDDGTVNSNLLLNLAL